MNVSVYNTVPRTSYGYYTRAELLETHVRIAGDQSAYRLSPAVRSLLKQRLHKRSLAARPSLSPKKKRGKSKEREGLAELAAFLVA